MSFLFPQLVSALVIVAGLLFAAYLGSGVGSSHFSTLVLIAAGMVGIGWVVKAREYWWLPMMAAIGIGGYITVPYKVFPHEIALLICAVGLVPQLIFHRGIEQKARSKLPPLFYVVGLYLIFHYAGCLVFYKDAAAGAGNISRAYMSAAWPFIFIFLFFRYGSTAILKACLKAMFVAYLFRMFFGLVNYYTDHVYVIPAINYSVDPQDLRSSAMGILTLTLVFFLSTKRAEVKVGCVALMGISVFAVLLGGSRGSMAVLLFIPVFLFFTTKRWMLLMACMALSACLIAAINAQPEMLSAMPYRVQRAFSILLIQKNRTDVQVDVQDSDLWHRVLLPKEAYNRWSRNATTMFVGTGIRRFQPLVMNWVFGRDALYFNAQVSADMGSYESGFWSVLAVYGGIGLFLAFSLLIWLLARLYPLVWRRGIYDLPTAVVFWACLSLALWLVFCVQQGSFPSFEVFIGFIALAAIRDQAGEQTLELSPIEVPVEDPLPFTPVLRHGRAAISRFG